VHRFATRVFTIAGIYGLIVLIPQYFTESRFATDFPPALTHAEYFYGFLGVTVAWQICFLVIARDPVRMRPVMIPAMLEKLAFSIPAFVLYARHRLATMVVGFAAIDVVFLVLFVAAYLKTPLPMDAMVEQG